MRYEVARVAIDAQQYPSERGALGVRIRNDLERLGYESSIDYQPDGINVWVDMDTMDSTRADWMALWNALLSIMVYAVLDARGIATWSAAAFQKRMDNLFPGNGFDAATLLHRFVST